MSRSTHKRKSKKPKGLLNAITKMRLRHGERLDSRGFRKRKGNTPENAPEPQELVVSHHSSSASDAGNDGFVDTMLNCLDD
jgi:hypothetical protein